MGKKDLTAKRKALFGRSTKRHGSFAIVQPKIRPKVSSAALRTLNDEDKAIRRRRRDLTQVDRSWQEEAFEYARRVGELGFLLNLQANVVALCDMPIQRWDDNQDAWVSNIPEFDDDGQQVDSDYDPRPGNVMRAFVGPTGGTTELVRRAAWNLFAAGEVHLLGTPDDGDNGILWEFLSVRELFPMADGQMVRQRAGLGSQVEELPGDNFTARLWRSSAEFSDLADCEVRRVLPILQEIVALTMQVDAVVKSRIPANMIYMPDTMILPPTSPTEGNATEDDDDDLVDELFDHMTAPISDPTSAARLMPFIVTGPRGDGGKSGIEVIELGRPVDMSVRELRQEALGRLAQGLDAPPEIISGKTNANHWTAANIDSEFIVKHIQPVGQLLTDFLTVAYLRPMLEAYEEMEEDEAAKFRLVFDPSPVIARADEARSARDLADWLSDEAILAANGFTKADMAGTEAVRQRRLWKLISSHPSIFGKLITLLPGFEDIDPELLGDLAPGSDEEQPVSDSAVEADEQEPAVEANDIDIVDAESGTETPDQPRGMSLLAERLATAADAAIGRAIERAGSRIVSLSQRHPDLRERVRTAGKQRALTVVTRADLAAMQTSPEALFRNAWDDLAADTRMWVADHMRDHGCTDERVATDAGALAAHLLCEFVSSVVVDGAFAPLKRHANGLRVPTATVAALLEQAAYAGMCER